MYLIITVNNRFSLPFLLIYLPVLTIFFFIYLCEDKIIRESTFFCPLASYPFSVMEVI